MTLASGLAISSFSFSQTCPDLSSYYQIDDPDWPNILNSLSESFSSCLSSSEYFALYGSAQLYSGSLFEAIESLERSLLLNPDNGAAMIDYGEALYQDGQLFAAIEIYELLLARSDIPGNLVDEVKARQARWQATTRRTDWQLEVRSGYDANLNGASDQDTLTLTLSGEPVTLSLGEEFRVLGGSLLNLRAQGSHQKIATGSQQTFTGEVLTRVSEHSRANLAQIGGRYDFSTTDRPSGWRLRAGINHLNFSGEPLFTAADSEVRYRFGRATNCQQHLGLALQHQTWHDQNKLNGLESKLQVGRSCSFQSNANHLFSADIGLIKNVAVKDDRLGGDRDGWQVNFGWQTAFSRGEFAAQVSHTRLRDRRGYSPLLAFDARRDISRNSVLLQYREALPVLGERAQLILNFFHQDQNSNLELFRIDDTSAEIGIIWSF